MSSLDDRLDQHFERLAHRLTDHRIPVLLVTLAITAAFAFAARRLTVNTTNEYMFTEGDPLLVQYEEFKEEFGSNEFLFVLMRVGDLFTPESLRAVDQLSTALEEGVPFVREVTSILDVEHIEGPRGRDRVQPLIGRDAIPDDLEGARALRERVFSVPEYSEVFVSPDATHAGIVVDLVLVDETIEGDYRKRVAAAVDEVIEDPTFAAWEPRVVGPPMLDTAMDETITREGTDFGGCPSSS